MTDIKTLEVSNENLKLLQSFKKIIPCPSYKYMKEGKYHVLADGRYWLITDSDIGYNAYIRTLDSETSYLEGYMWGVVSLIAANDEKMLIVYDQIVTHVIVCGKEVEEVRNI